MKLIVIILALIVSVSVLSGCDIIKEGITGERPEPEAEVIEEEVPKVPAAYPIIGDWFGVYGGNEYLSLRFTADGKCELQPAIYPSDMFGPRYYGDYRWGGEFGDEVFLDLYKGVSKEIDYGDGSLWDEWSDGGRENATTALSANFRVFGGSVKSVSMMALTAAFDTEGYAVVQNMAFVVLLYQDPVSGSNPSQFVFGSTPFDETEGKNLDPVAPDSFLPKAERLYTMAELNVRCGPGTDFGTYGTVPLGSEVDKIAYSSNKDEWAFVLLKDGGGGWCSEEYLAKSPPPEGPD